MISCAKSGVCRGYDIEISLSAQVMGDRSMADVENSRIGLIADSHGNLEATRQAIRLLTGLGADTLVHLGDFCDSILHDRTAAMIGLLEEHGVLAVKGNNDFLVESMLADARRSLDPEGKRTLAFLRDVPVTRMLNGLVFAHSLPFDSLRSFYEPIDTGGTQKAARLFAETDFQLLFCGHSHLPILFRKSGSRVTREQSPPLEKQLLGTAGDGPHRGENIGSEGRFIVVVGSADDGECALYDRNIGVYTRLRIFDRECIPRAPTCGRV
jgi:predicted phosphodiesterase